MPLYRNARRSDGGVPTPLRVGRVLVALAALGGGLLVAGSGSATAAPTAAAPTAAVAEHHHPPAAGPTAGRLARLRAATTRFHDIATAEDAGYGLLHDTAGIFCIDMPGQGGMGVHFVDGALVSDGAIDLRHPEAVVYAPDRDGTLRLAALEFIVDKAAWDAHHSARPELFRGAPFDLTTAPNRYGLAPFCSQHVWLYRHNPAGPLAMWNPRVHCP